MNPQPQGESPDAAKLAEETLRHIYEADGDYSQQLRAETAELREIQKRLDVQLAAERGHNATLRARVDTLKKENEQILRWKNPTADRPALLSELEAMIIEAQNQRDRAIAEVEHQKKIIATSCKDWADDDTAIKAICAKFGIRAQDTPGYAKPMVECVEEISALLARAIADGCALKMVAAEAVSLINFWFSMASPHPAKLEEASAILSNAIEAPHPGDRLRDAVELAGKALEQAEYDFSVIEEDEFRDMPSAPMIEAALAALAPFRQALSPSDAEPNLGHAGAGAHTPSEAAVLPASSQQPPAD